MSFTFPSSPTLNQQYSVSGGPTYTWNGTAWIVLTPGQQFNRQAYTATANQTSFSVSTGYLVGGLDVFRNGVKLITGTDYTATDGSTFILILPANNGDTVECISYSQILYSDALRKTGDTMTGNLTVPNITSNGFVVANNGLYSSNNYTGSYTDGIVVDYVTGNGRISVGPGDGLTIYNGGVANTTLVTLNSSGNLTFNTASSVTFNNNTAISAASTKSLTLNGGAGTNGLVIDASNNVGIGTASPTALRQKNLEVSSSGTNDGSAVIVGKRGTGIATVRLTGLDTTVGTDINFNFPNTGDFSFFDRAASATRMTLDSAGNLGLGVTPAGYGRAEIRDTAKAQLSVYGWSSTGGASDLNGAIYLGNNTAYQGRIYYDAVTGSLGNLWIENTQGNAGSAINFKNGGAPYKWFQGATQAMTLDASGNLGLGVTPSAWSGYGNLDGQNGFCWSSYDASLGSNYYYNSGYRYKATSLAASIYQLYNGTHKWYIAGTNSGAAGAAFTPTLAMYLDTGGNLGIGAPSPAYKLDVNGGIGISYAGAAKITWGYSGQYNNWIECGGVVNNNYMRFATGNAEAARIDSSGNFGIGTTAPGAKLDVIGRVRTALTTDIGNGFNTQINLQALSGSSNNRSAIGFSGTFYNYPADVGVRKTADIISGFATGVWGTEYLAFNVGASGAGNDAGNITNERMRIDGSGNLLIGTTGPASGRLTIVAPADASFIQTTGSTSTCGYAKVPGNSAYYWLWQNSAGSNIAYIRTTDGTTVTYNTGSDIRLKENITDSETALQKINSVRVRAFNWKSTGKKVDFGFIAQELNEVAAEVVSQGRDNEDGTIDVPWGVDNSILVPALVKAIQELSTKLDVVTSELESLKGSR